MTPGLDPGPRGGYKDGMSRPAPIVGFDPFQAPGWVQFYLDCVDGCLAQGVGGRDCALTLFRGGVVVGEVVIQVPEGAERQHPKQRRPT